MFQEKWLTFISGQETKCRMQDGMRFCITEVSFPYLSATCEWGNDDFSSSLIHRSTAGSSGCVIWETFTFYLTQLQRDLCLLPGPN